MFRFPGTGFSPYFFTSLPCTSTGSNCCPQQLVPSFPAKINDAKNLKKVLERWGRVGIVDAAFKGLQSFAWHSFYNLSLTVLVQLLMNLSPLRRLCIYLLNYGYHSWEKGTKWWGDQATAKIFELSRGRRRFGHLFNECICTCTGVSSSDTFYENFDYKILKPRKPLWWITLADGKGHKANRLVVPPLNISDIPYRTSSNPSVLITN